MVGTVLLYHVTGFAVHALMTSAFLKYSKLSQNYFRTGRLNKISCEKAVNMFQETFKQLMPKTFEPNFKHGPFMLKFHSLNLMAEDLKRLKA